MSNEKYNLDDDVCHDEDDDESIEKYILHDGVCHDGHNDSTLIDNTTSMDVDETTMIDNTKTTSSNYGLFSFESHRILTENLNLCLQFSDGNVLMHNRKDDTSAINKHFDKEQKWDSFDKQLIHCGFNHSY